MRPQFNNMRRKYTEAEESGEERLFWILPQTLEKLCFSSNGRQCNTVCRVVHVKVCLTFLKKKLFLH